MGVVLRLILSFNISSFYVYLRGLPLYIKTPEQSGAAHSDPPWHRFFSVVTGGSDISEAKSKGVTCFSRRRFPSKPARFLVQLQLLRPPVWAARSPLNSNYLHLSPPPSRMLNSWRCASPRSGGVSYQIFIFPCWASALHDELFHLLKSIHCHKNS